MEKPDVFLADKSGTPVFVRHKQSDDSDKWALIEYESMVNRKLNQIYVEDYQEKFAIENKKTKMVLDVPQKFLEVGEFEDKNSQLWTLETRNKSGYFMIRNVGNG